MKKDCNTMEKDYNWTEGTPNIFKAVTFFIGCRKSGYNCKIERVINESLPYPKRIKNPELDDPKNWRVYSGYSESPEELLNGKYFNKTEKELMICQINAEGKTETFVNHYEPAPGILYYIPDPRYKKVFAIATYGEDEKPNIWNYLFPVKLLSLFIPRFLKLCMDDYILYSLSFGEFELGFTIEARIPKNFKAKSNE